MCTYFGENYEPILSVQCKQCSIQYYAWYSTPVNMCGSLVVRSTQQYRYAANRLQVRWISLCGYIRSATSSHLLIRYVIRHEKTLLIHYTQSCCRKIEAVSISDVRFQNHESDCVQDSLLPMLGNKARGSYMGTVFHCCQGIPSLKIHLHCVQSE